jgi:hypothetical protein
MALHRDIFWVGRQWAVTGAGLQAVDQRRNSQFDIAIEELWEDGLGESMRAHAWLNADDFDKALAVARRRFPAPPGKAVLPQPEPPRPSNPPLPPQSPPPPPRLRIQGSLARFSPQWRVRQLS